MLIYNSGTANFIIPYLPIVIIYNTLCHFFIPNIRMCCDNNEVRELHFS